MIHAVWIVYELLLHSLKGRRNKPKITLVQYSSHHNEIKYTNKKTGHRHPSYEDLKCYLIILMLHFGSK